MDKLRLAQIPLEPGVYQYLNKDGEIIYVGKAKSLRKRVRSYFRGDHDAKTNMLVSKIVDVRTITTRNEVEALLLENQLIIKHKPKYNVGLKDSRRYAWIRVTDEKFPRIITARNKKYSGKYFGPFTDGTARRSIILTLNKLFQLRTCFTLPKNVCLQYHIKHCTGPCAGHDSVEDYGKRVKQAIAVLDGKDKNIVSELKEQMMKAAGEERFEEAKRLRDGIVALEQLKQRQAVEQDRAYDQDVIAYADNDDEVVFVVMHISRGVISKKNEYRVEKQFDVLEEFITALYLERMPPREIVTYGLSEEQEKTLSSYYTRKIGSEVRIVQPQRGDKKAVLDIAKKNALLALNQENPALLSLQKYLRLSTIPETIDCFDISTHQGAETVAACVRYRNGEPDPSMYRRFQIKTVVHDDFGAMNEALTRRYKTRDDLPDLIVIDGGKGQLSSALEALKEKGFVQPIISLAKQEEEVFVPGLPHSLPIPQNDAGLLLLRRIRDATHRFVIGYHRDKRRKEMSRSMLDHIPGIGPKKKELLYAHFNTFANIKKAPAEELQRVIGKVAGKTLYRELH